MVRALVGTTALLGVLIAACSTGAAGSDACVPRGSDSKGHRTTHKAAKRVVERYSLETMKRCDGVVGMGVGAKTEGNRPPAADEKVHHITILLRDAESRPPNTRSIAGVRIVWRVTGEFTAY